MPIEKKKRAVFFVDFPRSCEDSEKLMLMEANDNHEEEHTVAEFIEFCTNGRNSKSGEWTSKGVGNVNQNPEKTFPSEF